ncbi:hypothetical protein MMC29_006538 [Sticta canariensis]|nr:hypothetical protein [Sticta canariensis]
MDEAEQPGSPMDEGEKSGSTTPTPQPALNPDGGLGGGYLDHVLEIFNWHKHPFVVIEECAMTWMGATVPVGRQDCDILVRADQLPVILGDLLQTGRWIEVEHANRTQDLVIYADVRRIRRYPEVVGPDVDFCISLWTEQKYHLAVDGPRVEAFDFSALNTVLLEERFDPHDPQGPKLMSDFGMTLAPELKARSDRCPIPIFVPSIPNFLDADLDRYRDNVDKRLLDRPFVLTKPLHSLQLVRSLRLDLPHQRDRVLREMAPRNWAMMLHLIDLFARKSANLVSFTPEQERAWKERRHDHLVAMFKKSSGEGDLEGGVVE